MMRTSLAGLCLTSARIICGGKGHELECVAGNIAKVANGEEPISEFLRFYCFCADEPITDELLVKCGFVLEEDGFKNLTQKGRCLEVDERGSWCYSDNLCDTAKIKAPKTLAELWILCEALGFKIKVPQ
jgi:hypothetical protein